MLTTLVGCALLCAERPKFPHPATPQTLPSSSPSLPLTEIATWIAWFAAETKTDDKSAAADGGGDFMEDDEDEEGGHPRGWAMGVGTGSGSLSERAT